MRRAIALAAALLLAACGGGDDDTKDDASDATSTTVTTIAGETTTTGAAGGATTTTARGGSATTARGATATTTASAAKAPTPAAPGIYDYKQSGTSSLGTVPAAGTLTVDRAGANGAQVWHQADDPSAPPTDVFYAFRADGPFITRTIVRQAGQSVDCTFDQPVPAPPWPHTVGKTIAGHATCGAVTVDVSGSITGLRTATVEGKSVDVVVVTTTVTTTGQVNSTTNSVQWWAPSLRIPVHSENNTRGRFGAFAFSSNTTSDLVSTKPR